MNTESVRVHPEGACARGLPLFLDIAFLQMKLFVPLSERASGSPGKQRKTRILSRKLLKAGDRRYFQRRLEARQAFPRSLIERFFFIKTTKSKCQPACWPTMKE